MQRKRLVFISLVLIMASCMNFASMAADTSFTLDDRDRLIRIETRLDAMDKRFEQVDKRFEEHRDNMNKRFEEQRNDTNKRFDELREDMNKRFEQADRRFEELREDMNKRFEQVDKRFEQAFHFIWILATIFTAITATTIGFAIWDRRTMVRPFEYKTKELEKKLEELDAGRGMLEKVITALREMARLDVKLSGILRKLNLM